MFCVNLWIVKWQWNEFTFVPLSIGIIHPKTENTPEFNNNFLTSEYNTHSCIICHSHTIYKYKVQNIVICSCHWAIVWLLPVGAKIIHGQGRKLKENWKFSSKCVKVLPQQQNLFYRYDLWSHCGKQGYYKLTSESFRDLDHQLHWSLALYLHFTDIFISYRVQNYSIIWDPTLNP